MATVTAVDAGNTTNRRGSVTGVLDITGLTRHYGPVTALDGLSCHFPAGELVGFLGPNGAGKTTTMRIAMGLDRADAGSVTFGGQPLTPELRRSAGYLPEERGLYPKMAVVEQIELFARLRGLGGATARSATTTWLDRVELTGRRDDRLERLSQGNQQRVQLAVALIGDPELLLLDEPFSSLDPIGTDLMRDLLAERARAGATVIFSSHQLDLVEDLCREVVIIHAGRRVLAGAVDELRASGPRRLTVGTAAGWECSVPGTRMLEPDHRFGLARVGLDDGVEAGAVLADAQAAGEVWHFATELAPLSEVFRTAVAHDPALDPLPATG